MPPLKKLFKYISIFLVLIIVVIFICDYWVEYSSDNHVYDSLNKIPHNKVGVLLGTSKRVRGNRLNLYYKYRLDAAEKLFKASKIDYILVSGDNGSIYYNEPTTIKNDLIERGIPDNKIFLDYAGFRTFDSMVRAKEVFGEDKFTVISQEFHNRRAIFITKFKDIDAIAFNAKAVNFNYGIKTQIREKLARVKVVLDIIIGQQPKFLGEKIEIK